MLCKILKQAAKETLKRARLQSGTSKSKAQKATFHQKTPVFEPPPPSY